MSLADTNSLQGAFQESQSITSGDDALKVLKEGNKRFVEARPLMKDIGDDKRAKLAKGQKPIAIVLSCSDSRVPPELIFDQGLGDLFVVRVAGNISDTIALGSIEYAAEHLHSPLLVVLGHSNCGAVKATFEGGDFTPSIGAIASKIWPSVEVAISRNDDAAAIVEDAVIENVKAAIEDVKSNSPVIRELLAEGKFRVAGGKYDLETGEVTFFD